MYVWTVLTKTREEIKQMSDLQISNTGSLRHILAILNFVKRMRHESFDLERGSHKKVSFSERIPWQFVTGSMDHA